MKFPHNQRFQRGFSAVELMITLFIAAAFVATGYQLYNVVVRSSGESQALARASNLAYDYMYRYANSSSVQDPCSASTPLSASSVSGVQGLSNVKVTVVVSCPGTPTTLSKVEARVTYGGGSAAGEVRHATFVTI